MKNIVTTLFLTLSISVFGQIDQNVNKTTGTISNSISNIDSIRFNVNGTAMEIVLNSGSVESHLLSEIINVTFDAGNAYPPGTVHCDPSNPTAIVEVINPNTGKIWMDRNLGAIQVAESSTDEKSYGDLYQWGRRSDGHQCLTSLITTTLSSVDQPAHGDFILPPSTTPGDWRSPENTNLWQGVNGINNPCPWGFRIPTLTELNSEGLSWSSVNSDGAFASPLKLPMAGIRGAGTGGIFNLGVQGWYRSSTSNGSFSTALYFNSSSASLHYSGLRAAGCSVRCIKD